MECWAHEAQTEGDDEPSSSATVFQFLHFPLIPTTVAAQTISARLKLKMAVPGRRNGLIEDEDDDEQQNYALFEEGLADVDSDTPPHLLELSAAVHHGDVEALRVALDNLNGNIDEPVEDGDTALHLACLYGHLSCVQLLLDRGANIEAKDEDGAVALHDACAGGYVDIVQLLLSRATNSECARRMLETVDEEGDTPLHHAARGDHVDVVRVLLASRADPTKRNTYGKTPGELSDQDSEAKGLLDAATSAATSAMSCQ